jgi:hypothetical protein
MNAEVARVLDELTVVALEEGTPRGVLARIRLDERAGVDAYACEPPTWGERQTDPRAELRVCGAPDCAAAFWTSPMAPDRLWCSVRCRVRRRRPATKRRLPHFEGAA